MFIIVYKMIPTTNTKVNTKVNTKLNTKVNMNKVETIISNNLDKYLETPWTIIESYFKNINQKSFQRDN